VAILAPALIFRSLGPPHADSSCPQTTLLAPLYPAPMEDAVGGSEVRPFLDDKLRGRDLLATAIAIEVFGFAPQDQLLAAAPLLGPRPQHFLEGRRPPRSRLRTRCRPLRPHLGAPSGSPSSIRVAALLVGFDLSSAHLALSSTSASPLRCPLRRLSYRSLLHRSLLAGLLAVWVTSPPTRPALVFTAAVSSPPFAASPSSWAPMYPSVAVTRFLGLFTGYAERGKVCTANELGLASTKAGRVFNIPLLVALSWVSSHEHLGLGYCFLLLLGCSRPVDYSTCSSTALHQQPAWTTSPIATAARGRAALKGWCSVMVVGPALGLGPLGLGPLL
jgi:hypothetical protein